MSGGWELDGRSDFTPRHEHVPTGTTCLQCHGTAGQDDQGACHGKGFLCTKCGFYRLPREVKPPKKTE